MLVVSFRQLAKGSARLPAGGAEGGTGNAGLGCDPLCTVEDSEPATGLALMALYNIFSLICEKGEKKKHQ